MRYKYFMLVLSDGTGTTVAPPGPDEGTTVSSMAKQLQDGAWFTSADGATINPAHVVSFRGVNFQ